MNPLETLMALRERGIVLTVQNATAPNDFGRIVPVKWLWAHGPMLPTDWEKIRGVRAAVVKVLEGMAAEEEVY